MRVSLGSILPRGPSRCPAGWPSHGCRALSRAAAHRRGGGRRRRADRSPRPPSPGG